MARKLTARRIARLTPLVAVAAATLAAPSPASAQQPDNYTGAGKLYYSTNSGSVWSVWPSGKNQLAEVDLPQSSAVGHFGPNGAQLTFAAQTSTGYRVDIGPPATSIDIEDPNGGALPVNSVAMDPFSVNVAVATAEGLSIVDPDMPNIVTDVPTGVPGLGAGRVEWAFGTTAQGVIVWDGIATEADPGGGVGIPGGDVRMGIPSERTTRSSDTTGGGIWAREGDGAIREVVKDQTAANPSVSQDGKVIAYESVANPGTGVDIWVLDRNDANPTPVRLAGNSLGDDTMPAVSPDGTQVAFYNQTTQKLVTVHTDGVTPGNPNVAPASAGITGLAWRPEVAAEAGTVSISGTVAVDETLTAVNGTSNSGTLPFSEEYVWERCDDLPDRRAVRGDGPDPSCTVIAGSTTTHKVVQADVGKRLRVTRVVSNAAGTSKSYSGRSIVVPASNSNPNPNPVDTTKPEAPSFDGTPAKLTNETLATFTWTGAEAGGRFECFVAPGDAMGRRDGPSWVDCASGESFPNLTEGKWTFYLRQVDDANNLGDVKTFTWEVDTTGPDQVILMETPFLVTPFPTQTFKFNKSDEANTLECRLLDGLAREAGVGSKWSQCSSPVVLNLPNGKYTFQAREVDPAGNASKAGPNSTWSGEVKVVKTPTHPVEEKPVVETPAPVVEAPKPAPVPAPVVEEPKPAAPRAVAKPEVKAPALVATIGGTKSGAQVGANGSTSAAATIEVAKESVGVGCSITGTVLKSCKVDLYAPRASGATARAAASNLVLVGTGTYVSKGGSEEMDVKIELNSVGKKMLRENPAGLRVQVKILGKPVSGKPLQATGVAKLVTDRASLTVGGFDVRSSVLTSTAKKQLRTLAKFGKAGRVTCVGHTDGSSQDDDYLKSLGARRAKAVCAYLAKHGLKASTKRLASKADTKPAATNATKAGRAKNRRVQVTIVR